MTMVSELVLTRNQLLEVSRRHVELGIIVPSRNFEQLIAGEDELRHHRHQPIERVDTYPDRLTGNIDGGAVARFYRMPKSGGGIIRGSDLVETPLEAVQDPRRAGSRASELLNQVAIVASRFALQLLQAIEDYLDPVDSGEDQRYGFASDGRAVPEFAHQRLGGMGERLEPRQSKKAAGAFYSVNEAKDVAEYLAVIRLSLKAHQLCVDVIETLGGLDQKLPQQIIHERLVPPVADPAILLASTNPLKRRPESVGKGFNFGCGIGESGRGKGRSSSTGGYDDGVAIEPRRNCKAAIARQNAGIERLDGMRANRFGGGAGEKLRGGRRQAGV